MKIAKHFLGKLFFLCRGGEQRPYVWKSSRAEALDLSKADALALAKQLELIVVHLVSEFAHIDRVVRLDQLDNEVIGVDLIIIVRDIGGRGDALDQPDSAVSAGEQLAVGGDAHEGSSCEKGAAYHAKFVAKSIEEAAWKNS